MDLTPGATRDLEAFIERWTWARFAMEDCMRYKPPKPPPTGGVSMRSRYYLFVFYSMIDVLIEGWRTCGFQYPEVDVLLGAGRKNLVRDLKEFRNHTFHFQREKFGRKMRGFFDRGSDAALWTHGLMAAFAKFLDSQRPQGTSGHPVEPRP